VVEVAGVWTWVVAPFGVVTVMVSGVGSWMVTVLPDGVLTETVESHDATVSVAVPPPRVTTWETRTEDGAKVTELMDGGAVDDLTKADDDSETTVPDSVTTGTLELDGAV
jgi:hypothetical protein